MTVCTHIATQLPTYLHNWFVLLSLLLPSAFLLCTSLPTTTGCLETKNLHLSSPCGTSPILRPADNGSQRAWQFVRPEQYRFISSTLDVCVSAASDLVLLDVLMKLTASSAVCPIHNLLRQTIVSSRLRKHDAGCGIARG